MKAADKISMQYVNIRNFFNPFTTVTLFMLTLPCIIFGGIFVFVFMPNIGVKYAIFGGAILAILVIVISEKRMNNGKDFDLNSASFQLAVVMAGSLSLGAAIGYDMNQINQESGLFFFLISYIILFISVAMICDTIRFDLETEGKELEEEEKRTIKRLLTCCRMKAFLALSSVYLVLPLIIGFSIGYIFENA